MAINTKVRQTRMTGTKASSGRSEPFKVRDVIDVDNQETANWGHLGTCF